MFNKHNAPVLFFCLLMALTPVSVVGQSDQKNDSVEKKEPTQKDGSGKKDDTEQRFSVADGYLNFVAPGAWKKIKPKFDFYHAEFKISRAEGDGQDGRITFSLTGGTIDANFERWIGQFEDTDTIAGEAIKKNTKTIDGKNVQRIQISGTFTAGGGGPMAPKTALENYILIGAAIEADQGGTVYIKAYGPRKTMEANRKALEALLNGMKVSEG